MDGAKEVEFFIFNNSQMDTAFIADELLKLWNKDKLSIKAKLAVSSFCFANGFVLSLIKSLRSDLLENRKTYWPLIFYFVKKSKKEVIDAVLTGAAQNNQLLELALYAQYHNVDLRWKKIIVEELNKQQKEVLNEISILEKENLVGEAQSLAKKWASLSPSNEDFQKQIKDFDQKQVTLDIQQIKRNFENFKKDKKLQQNFDWPELKLQLQKQKGLLDLEQCTDLSIGLSEMGFNQMALDVLAFQKQNWSTKEKLLEIDFLLKAEHFVEALEKSQEITKQNVNNRDVLKASLYFTAQALYQLDDKEQALSIIRAIHMHDPKYKDLSELIRIWGREV